MSNVVDGCVLFPLAGLRFHVLRVTVPTNLPTSIPDIS